MITGINMKEAAPLLKNLQALCVLILEESDIGAARRKAKLLASSHHFLASEQEKIALIISELGSNLIKHGIKNKNKYLLFQVIEKDGVKIFEIVAIDPGPGMKSVAECLEDGYSSTSTGGNGLGAVSRLSDFLEIYSLPSVGSLLLAHVFLKPTINNFLPSNFDIGGICLPILTEERAGDGWSFYQDHKRLLILVADGLGHGAEASVASERACKVFDSNIHESPLELISIINKELKGTRGAAVSVMEIDKIKNQVKYAGLGNVSGSVVVDKKVHRLMSHDGTAGLNCYSIREHSCPWSADAFFIMHTDGLTSRWTTEPYPGLSMRHPTLIASVLFRDFFRGNDDVTIVIGKQKKSSQKE